MPSLDDYITYGKPGEFVFWKTLSGREFLGTVEFRVGINYPCPPNLTEAKPQSSANVAEPKSPEQPCSIARRATRNLSFVRKSVKPSTPIPKLPKPTYDWFEYDYDNNW